MSVMKIAGSGSESGSGSISQRPGYVSTPKCHGSATLVCGLSLSYRTLRKHANFYCLNLWFYWFCCRASVREENPSGSSTRVLTLVTSAQAQHSVSIYGPATSALHALKGQVPTIIPVSNGQLFLDLQLSSTSAASHCPLFDLQISSASVSSPGDKQTQATGRKATSDHENTGSLNLVKNRDAPIQHYETQVPVLGIRSTRQRNNNQSKYQCLFICVSCDVQYDVPFFLLF